ncbi:hypothetical protein N186_01145 [Thermofilum adornatum]|uniref:Uncharacterized protein n=1 Tax=Thermofilum adornatum TaxID=1365176 RepID=S5ZJG2_9CREN|nr:hypothetical protein N186_01145 [Thermofilum adornatum]
MLKATHVLGIAEEPPAPSTLSIAIMKPKPLNAQQARAVALIQSHIPYTLPDLDVTDKSATHRVNSLTSLTFTVSQLNRIYKKIKKYF